MVFVELAITIPIKLTIAKYCWNIENYELPPQSPDLNPIKQIWGELENKLYISIVHSKENLWLNLGYFD